MKKHSLHGPKPDKNLVWSDPNMNKRILGRPEPEQLGLLRPKPGKTNFAPTQTRKTAVAACLWLWLAKRLWLSAWCRGCGLVRTKHEETDLGPTPTRQNLVWADPNVKKQMLGRSKPEKLGLVRPKHGKNKFWTQF